MTTIKPALELGARAAIAHRTEALLRRVGAVRDGHLRLGSGDHVGVVFDVRALLADPAATSEVCAFLAGEYGPGEGRDEPRVDAVAGPPGSAGSPLVGGAILAFETARQIGVRAILAAPTPDAEEAPARGARVLLVDDAVISGRAIVALAAAVEAAGGEIVGCAAVADLRGGGPNALVSRATGRSYPFRALWRPSGPAWEPGTATCPRCADGTPLGLPGTAG
jgi:orotate phosphoribosyltransferase